MCVREQCAPWLILKVCCDDTHTLSSSSACRCGLTQICSQSSQLDGTIGQTSSTVTAKVNSIRRLCHNLYSFGNTKTFSSQIIGCFMKQSIGTDRDAAQRRCENISQRSFRCTRRRREMTRRDFHRTTRKTEHPAAAGLLKSSGAETSKTNRRALVVFPSG